MADLPDGEALDALLDATSDGVAVLEADGTVVDANDQFIALAGADRDAVEGAPWTSLFADAPDLATLQGHDDRVEATLQSADRDGAFERNDDAYAGTPVSVACRRVGEHVVATVADRTANVERDRFERILESVDDGIYMLDAQGRIEYVNQAALDAHDLNYDREDIVGEFATVAMPAEDIEACVEAIQSLIADEDAQSEQVTVTVEDRDGTEVPAELNLSLLPAVDGEYSGSVGVLRDVTERRRRDQMLRVLNRVLRHNLRNDMNVVVGMTQLIRSEHPAVDAEYTDRIERVASGLVELGGKARVVEELTGPGTQAPQTLDVVPVIEHALASCDASDDAGDIEFDAPASVTALVPPLFEAAVENVVENALQHADDPSVSVTVEDDVESDRVRIAVTDDGPGIPTAELEALRSATETPLEHASGLGLWLTDWIVQFADGDVSYDVDDGTTVTMELPAAEKREPQDD